ncbi:MAG TPA: SRPBCC family protein [Streptosporangiaceae bacterium]|jgi:hypothetical protein
MHVITVTRRTTATPEAVWDLFADYANRTSWDDSLEKITVPPGAAFRAGATGTVKLAGQPARRFEILRCTPHEAYTDRFFLPMGGKMDWVHTLRQTGDGLEVSFDVSVSGPTAFILGPIMKKILNKDLPPTVDKLVALAERR